MTHRFYVTTPIYYVNDVPHLGSAYTTIAVDVMARYHRLRGHETRSLTGTDEHGLKIQRAADERGVAPQAFVDEVSAKFREAWPRLECDYDDFLRTTEPRHKAEVQALWTKIQENGDIYLGHYEGLYCVACEAYYTEKELQQPGNICHTHQRPAEMVKEESYFFRLSKYADKLLDLYASQPDFVRPAGRFNEVKSFVKEGLQDLSVSRTTFTWGVPVPGDPRHVMYVWFDALSNYYTSLLSPEDHASLWPHAVHVVGKDILRFHAIYWPAFLMAAGLPLPKQVFAHGFLTYNGKKMSKTLRNTVSPVALAEALSQTGAAPSSAKAVGVDVTRYVLLRAIAFGQDGDFAIKDVLQRYASELGNALGNLLNRIHPFATEVPEKGELTDLERDLVSWYPSAAKAVAEAYDDLNPTAALTAIWSILARGNEYIDKAAPWTAKKKGDTARVGTIAATLIELLEAVSVMVAPVMPSVAAAMREQLGLPALDWAALRASREDRWPAAWPQRKAGETLRAGVPIFPRFEKEREAEIIKQFTPPEEPGAAPAAGAGAAPAADAGAAPAKEAKATIAYDDFAKIDLRIGLVVSAERVKKKDKLLDLRVDTGDAEPRRIIAGIALAYAPEALVGKRVVVLCNLAPRDFGKGLVSQGMLLAAEDGNGLRVVTVDGGDKAPGSPVK